MVEPLVEIDASRPFEGAPDALTAQLEAGKVIVFHGRPFALGEFEKRFVERPFSDGKSKNVSIRGDAAELRGAAGTPEELAALQAMLVRYKGFATELIARYFPAYAGVASLAGTSYRPFDVDVRKLSWRRDDTRLHVDAFPSNPIGGKRILRVFTNINGTGQPRIWRVGEPFEAMASRFLPKVPAYSGLKASLLSALGITKARRSEYDHIMLHLHDLLKSDERYQQDAPQATVAFEPGTVWVTFSDLVLHAAMGGRYMLEQTAYLPHQKQADVAKSPQAILGRLVGHAVV